MEAKRIIIDAKHGHQRSRVFAILILVGLGVVFGVWFFQLNTMFRYAKLSEVTEDFAVFEEAMRATSPDAPDVTEAAAGIAATVQEAMVAELAEQQAKDAVAAALVEGFANEARPAEETSDTAEETTVSE